MKAADHFSLSCLPEHPPFCRREITFMGDLIHNVESLMQVLCGFLSVLHKGVPWPCYSTPVFLSLKKKMAFNMREIIHTSKHCPVVGGWDET